MMYGLRTASRTHSVTPVAPRPKKAIVATTIRPDSCGRRYGPNQASTTITTDSATESPAKIVTAGAPPIEISRARGGIEAMYQAPEQRDHQQPARTQPAA